MPAQGANDAFTARRSPTRRVQAELVWFQGIELDREAASKQGREYLVFGRPAFFRGGALAWCIPRSSRCSTRKADSTRPCRERCAGHRLAQLSGCRRCWVPKAIHTLDEQCVAAGRRASASRETLASPRCVRAVRTGDPLRDALYNIHFPTVASRRCAAAAAAASSSTSCSASSSTCCDSDMPAASRRKRRIPVSPDRGQSLFNTFYSEQLPFPLTGAQKRVDARNPAGHRDRACQMNRLAAGRRGQSGKTLVALLSHAAGRATTAFRPA